MLYKNNKKSDKLSMELFKNPTSEYRGAPFWAWNCTLEKDELLWQIEQLKKMGFGGFHMHSRAGMNSPYLSEEFFDLVRACADKAEAEGMLAYLYDEDRWSSGAAGGFVTRDERYRQKFLQFTTERMESVSAEQGYLTGKPYLVGCFDVELKNGCLSSYKMIDDNDIAEHRKWYVYCCTEKCSGWYNGQTYVDTMSVEAMNRFIELTYEGYKNAIGEKFGNSVPSIFTDEPQLSGIVFPSFSEGDEISRFPWTNDFSETFLKEYGADIIARLPELRWENESGVNTVRYQYMDHITERFCRAFADNCGKWCEENGIYLTGHMLCEQSLSDQSSAVGEAMRSYRGFGLPGIDMLCNAVELSTAKQAQSAVHQYGREGVMSELYGVTGWTFDFRGHKFQGDWQAALGVTLRVPHLSWVSMKGSAKRDYPASINYQSPWYEEYSYIENHFARLNTVLTRGVPVVNVGVIHPIESFWTVAGCRDVTGLAQKELEASFFDCINRLLFGTVDFDFISEALLPTQSPKVNCGRLNVGEMSYSAIVVPNVKTLRSSTLKLLSEFQSCGGRVIFIGDCPKLVDAKPSDDVRALFDASIKLSSASSELTDVLEDERFVSIIDDSGNYTKSYVYNHRVEGDDTYLFIARAEKYEFCDNVVCDNVQIIIKGEFSPILLNTLTGKTEAVDFEIKNGKTVIKRKLYQNDSTLLKLTKAKTENKAEKNTDKASGIIIDFKSFADYKRQEDNVLLLDMAQWRVDGTEYNDTEEILRIDCAIRKEKDWPLADGNDVQPWMIEEDGVSCFPQLKFTFDSEVEADCELAFEGARSVTLNGEDVPIEISGYFVDKSIQKIRLPKLKIGENVLEVQVPISKRVSIENLFLLGDFDVLLQGTKKTICAPSRQIAFGSITNQGMPFYGGNLEMNVEFETPACDAEITISRYRGSLLKVSIDDKNEQRLVFSPYKVRVNGLGSGKHTLKITFFGNRNNTFGPLHMCDKQQDWIGPNAWYTENDRWCYEYCLAETGVLSSPVIELLNVK